MKDQTPQTVAVIGAGPSGLVCAKTLLQWPTAEYHVTVFEMAHRPGGLWPTSPDEADDVGRKKLCDPEMPLNTSRMSATFSDLAWESVDMSRPRPGPGQHSGSAAVKQKIPMFPRAWQAGRYLEAYARKYIPKGVIRFGCKVTSASQIDHQGRKQWSLCVSHRESDAQTIEEDTLIFDRLIMASGFLSQSQSMFPQIPSSSSPNSHPRIIHSASISKANSLFNAKLRPKGDKVLVVGGANSAGDTAATLSFQLSNVLKSPQAPRSSSLEKLKIYHVTPRPIYGCPQFFASSASAGAPFLPVEVSFFDLAGRPPGEPICFGGRQSPDQIATMHGFASAAVGGDQSDLHAPALVPDIAKDGAMHATLTESYSEYVRDGTIVPLKGRLDSLHLDRDTDTLTARISGHQTVADIAAVLDATGFTASKSLSILAPDILAALEYDPASQRLPIILADYQTSNPSVPSLAFVGFYEGTFWGMLEMQARLVAHRWAAGDPSIPTEPSDRTAAFESKPALRDLRAAMRDHALDVPQYWFVDFAGYMECIAAEVGLPRTDAAMRDDSGKRTGNVTPARYLSPARGADGVTHEQAASEARTTLAALKAITSDPSTYCIYTAQAVFRALQGHWSLRRRLPSGQAQHGRASFHPRVPTSPAADREMLYVEAVAGADVATEGVADREDPRPETVWRFNEAATGTKPLSSSSSSPPDADTAGLTVWQHPGALLQRLVFAPGQVREVPGPSGGACRVIVAGAAGPDGAGDADKGKVRYEFRCRAIAVVEWRVLRRGEGGQGDVETVYVRPGR